MFHFKDWVNYKKTSQPTAYGHDNKIVLALFYRGCKQSNLSSV